MNRGLALFTALLYVAGGVIAGVIAHPLIVAHFGETVTALLQNPYVMALPAIIVLALAIHFTQTLSARKAGADNERRERELGKKLGVTTAELDDQKLAYADLETKLKEQETILAWCKKAIGDASVSRIPVASVDLPPLEELGLYDEPQQPKDYSEHTEGK